MIVRPFRTALRSLSFQFAFLLAVLLLPIASVALIQTKNLKNEAQARASAALVGAAFRAARQQTQLIVRTQGTVAGLAAGVAAVVDDPTACAEMMKKIAGQNVIMTLVAFIPLTGLMTCSNTGKTHDFSGLPRFAVVRDGKVPTFSVNTVGPVSQTSVLGISYPVFGRANKYLGFVSISLSHDVIADFAGVAQSGPDDGRRPVAFWTFDKNGLVLSANTALDQIAKVLPQDRPLAEFVGQPESVFRTKTTSGKLQTFALVPLVNDELYLMASWHPVDAAILDRLGISPYLYPILMWLVSLIVAVFAAERLVTRHVRTLSNSIIRFSRGDRRLDDLDLRAAPVELQQIGDAYLIMTQNVSRSETELENTILQKEILLRELHHRVNNNLQLIASVMNIQTRESQSFEAKILLKNLQERVVSLATIHQSLFKTTRLADVKAQELIPDIVRQIVALSSGRVRLGDVTTDIDDIRLVPDQAVPMSLVIAEGLSDAIKSSGASRNNRASVRVSLKWDDATDVTLQISHSILKPQSASSRGDYTHSSIGPQLMSAFAQQLRGRLTTTGDDTTHTLSLTWTVSAVTANTDSDSRA